LLVIDAKIHFADAKCGERRTKKTPLHSFAFYLLIMMFELHVSEAGLVKVLVFFLKTLARALPFN
jgi:hypothetical protein